MKNYFLCLLISLLPVPALFSAPATAQKSGSPAASGPLRVHPANPRYFADAGGRPVYLTGSHTWESLQDGILTGYTAATQPFDYNGYLDLLQTNHHNFIRLWRWELTDHEPQPWPRTGPDKARDGKPKLPKQHPVGMTSVGDMNPDCLKSPADWTSLSTARWDRTKDPWASAPPTADAQKVVLLDTDHIGWKIFINDAAFTRAWVWKSFTRGYSTLLMENLSPGAGWIAGRAAMGHTRGYAERMDLAKATPQLALASTGYCLAIPGTEYLVYLPEGGKVTVDLSNAHGKLTVEWLRPTTGQISPSTPVPGGAQHEFTAPFPGDAVLYLQHRKD